MTRAADSEVIAVRADEQLDLTRLEPWLRAHLPDATGPLAIRQFGGGHANLTYLLQFDDTEYVLRRPPLGPVAPSAHDMRREHRVLARLGTAFPLAPASYALCTDPGVLGVDFHVMERRRGIVIRRELPPELEDDPERNRRIGEMIVDVLADLHQVNPAAVGLHDLGRPAGFVQRQLDGWGRRWHAAKHTDVADIDRVLGWLQASAPAAQVTALLHNDYKLDNLLVDASDPATPVAVLDWDMTTRGDPLMDLGYLLNFWNEAGDDPRWHYVSRMPTDHAGFPTRAEVVERYARRTGLQLDAVTWYHVFGVFKLAVIVQQIYIRYLRGQTQDQRFAGYDERVRDLARKGVELMSAAEVAAAGSERSVDRHRHRKHDGDGGDRRQHRDLPAHAERHAGETGKHEPADDLHHRPAGEPEPHHPHDPEAAHEDQQAQHARPHQERAPVLGGRRREGRERHTGKQNDGGEVQQLKKL